MLFPIALDFEGWLVLPSKRKRNRNLKSNDTTEKTRAPRSLHLLRDIQLLTMEACCGDTSRQIHSGKTKSSTTPLAKQ
ncbi:hypothetical protein V6N11_056600 [Hibiscus sabdariffa]|uniref:Uncharacterized protein n=1 Tax=Hibiscus sabdariffa TaxID=183260 RepID=A0ABR2T4Y1_9ROSI